MLEANTILLGRYRIVRQIGLGDLGAVYEAVDENLGHTVALKEMIVQGEVLREVFKQEAPRLGRLRHAALPRVSHQFMEKQAHYLVMDYVPGENLAQMMAKRDGPFSVEQVLRWADQLLEVLIYLHGHETPIIHCDIKPSNIKLTAQDEIILLNFSLPKGGPLEGIEGESKARYAPLEQIRAMGTNERSDLYALGATLYYLLSGVQPPDALNDRAKKLVQDEPDPLQPIGELNSEVPPAVADLLMQTLALNPVERPASAKEMRLALQQALHPELKPLSEEAQASEATEPKKLRSVLLSVFLLVFLLLVLGGGASMLFFSGSEREILPTPAQSSALKPSVVVTNTVGVTDTVALPTSPPVAENSSNLSEPEAIVPSPTAAITMLTGSLAERPQRPISVANRGDVLQLARWGRGTANQVLWSPSGESVLIASSIGVYRYDPKTSEQTLLIETKSTINEVAFAPDGVRLAIGFEDNTIELWNVETQAYLSILNEHSYSVRSLAFAPNGTTLASGSDDGTVKVWDLTSGTVRYSFEDHTDLVLGVAFAPDGSLLASASNDGSIRVWDMATGTNRYTLTGHSAGVRNVDFAPNGQTIASASLDNTINLWDLTSGTLIKTLTGHTDQVRRVAFAPDGITLASASDDETIKVWDVASGSERQTISGHSSQVRSVAFSPDGSRLVSNSYNSVKVWETQSGNPLQSTSLSDQVWSSAFSPDGTRMATTSGKGRIDLWEVSTGDLLHTLHDHTDKVLEVAFSPDGALLASGSGDETVKLWEVQSGNLLQTFTGPVSLVSGVAFSPDGSLLAATSGNGNIQVWNVASREPVHTLTGHTNQTVSVSFSPNGKMLASTSADQTIKVWEAESGNLLQTLSGHTNWVWSVTFSPDGNTLASASADNTINLWEVKSGTLLQSLVGDFDWVRKVAFSPDGTVLASASNNFYQSHYNLKLWNVANGTLLRSFDNHTFTVNSVAFTPDGLLLASSSEDGTVRLWGIR